MGIKEKLMEKMMDGMSGEEKKHMMSAMAENFFSGMTEDEKKEMMQSMMSKMMGGGGSMMNMMGMMMGNKEPDGKGFNPMDMCQKMMGSFGKATEMASFATPEIRGLFEEWLAQIEEEFMSYINKSDAVNPDRIAEHFKLSKDSVTYFLTRLAQKGRVTLEAKTIKGV
jgi:hypothetical protein